ncbi:MAG: RibD family protein [Candidatus Omnitrophota bacterium]
MKRPYITIKFAETMDGKIAALDGSSGWISSLESRKFAHRLRRENDAVLVGAQTVIKDNPFLTTRLVKGKNPIRIVVDGKLRITGTSNIVKLAKKVRTIVITTPGRPKKKVDAFLKKGVQFIFLKALRESTIDLKEIIRILYKKGIKKILVEGGANIIAGFLKRRLADKIIIVLSPKILGKGVESVGNLGIKNIKKALKLRVKSVRFVSGDLICTAFL